MTRCPKCGVEASRGAWMFGIEDVKIGLVYRPANRCPIDDCDRRGVEHMSYTCPNCKFQGCGPMPDPDFEIEYHEKRPRGLIGRLFRR